MKTQDHKKILYTTCVLLLLLLNAANSFGATNDTLKVYYDINKYDIPEKSKVSLDSLLNMVDKHSAIIIKGYADNLGGMPLNQRLSFKRAQIISTYFSSLDHSLMLSPVGNGQMTSPADDKVYGNPQNRRVDIIFTRKDVPVAVKTIRKKLSNDIDTLEFKKKTDSLSTIAVGGKLSIDELTFIQGRHFLDSASNIYLKILAQYFVQHKNLAFELRGHICCMGDSKEDGYDPDERNFHLSKNRAQEIYNYFLKNGIDANRMTVTGVGNSQPKIYPEISPYDEHLNRRVEIIILRK